MKTPQELIHRLQSFGKGICWHPAVSLDTEQQQRLHEMLTEAANHINASEDRIITLQSVAQTEGARTDRYLKRIEALEHELSECVIFMTLAAKHCPEEPGAIRDGNEVISEWTGLRSTVTKTAERARAVLTEPIK